MFTNTKDGELGKLDQFHVYCGGALPDGRGSEARGSEARGSNYANDETALNAVLDGVVAC
jgi:hypothetical protein